MLSIDLSMAVGSLRTFFHSLSLASATESEETMTLKQLISKVESQKKVRHDGIQVTCKNSSDIKKERITKRMLLDSGMKVIAELTSTDLSIKVFENGYVIYEYRGNYTVFSITEIDEFVFTSIDKEEGRTCEDIPFMNEVYSREQIAEFDWYVGIFFIGEEYLKENSDKRNYYTPIQNITFDGSDDYGEIKTDTTVRKDIKYGTEDFTEGIDTKVDVERVMENLTKDQNDVIRSKYWADKSFIAKGMEMGSEYNAASQRAKGVHDRGINSIRRNQLHKLENYEN